MLDRNIFSERLIELRSKNKIMAKDIAECIGITKQAFSQYEKKLSTPSTDVIIAIAKYFDVSLDYLTGRTDNPDIANNKKSELLNDGSRLIKDKSDNFYVSNADNALTASTYKEKELLESFRLLEGLEQNVVLGKISEMIYNKNIEKNNLEAAEEIVEIDLKDRLNK